MAATPDRAGGPGHSGWIGRVWRRKPDAQISRAGRLEYDRILFFTDAVFAIAITLLIVDLPVQIERQTAAHQHAISAATELHQDGPGIAGFALSFAVIALFWIGHHSTFRYIVAIDRNLMRINLLFLGVIAFLPYPTQLLSSVSLDTQPAAVAFYATCAGTAGLLETIAWVYANQADLVEGVTPQLRLLFTLRAARIPAVFAVSIVIAELWSPVAATYSWIAIPVTGIAINRVYGHHEPETPPDEPDPEDPPAIVADQLAEPPPDAPADPALEPPADRDPPSPAGPAGGSG
jgi:uncharacterized membrane protein